MGEKEKRLNDVRKYGRKRKGRAEYIRYLEGERLYRSQAIAAKCYDCEGWYQDGPQPCLIEACPLYPYNPYNVQAVRDGEQKSKK